MSRESSSSEAELSSYRPASTAEMMQVDSGTGAIGREVTMQLIHTDLSRTFPELELFDEEGPYYGQLKELLEVFACFRPDLGYIQGMSYLAAMLCLHMPEYDDRALTFQCLANLVVSQHFFVFFQMDGALLSSYYNLFEGMLADRLPRIAAHLASIGVQPDKYLYPWLQNMYLQVLPLEIASRVWDCFLLDGTSFLLRTAIAIIELFAPELLSMDFEDVMPLLQHSPKNRSGTNVSYASMWESRIKEKPLLMTVDSVLVSAKHSRMLAALRDDAFFFDKDSAGHTELNEAMNKKSAVQDWVQFLI
jgi:hypothetical protein